MLEGLRVGYGIEAVVRRYLGDEFDRFLGIALQGSSVPRREFLPLRFELWVGRVPSNPAQSLLVIGNRMMIDLQARQNCDFLQFKCSYFLSPGDSRPARWTSCLGFG